MLQARETFSISCWGQGLAREKQSTLEPETSHGPTGGYHVGRERRMGRDLTQNWVSGRRVSGTGTSFPVKL